MTPMDLSAALGSLSAIGKAIKGIRELTSDAKINERVIELQNLILDLQGDLSTAISKYTEMERQRDEAVKKVAYLDEWEATKKLYGALEIASGIVVYAKTTLQSVGGPADWCCPRCFGEKKLAIFSKVEIGNRNYRCVSCAYEITPTPFPKLRQVPQSNYGGGLY